MVFCASSACGVSVEHMNAKKPMIRSTYRFHVYYHIRRILKIIEIPLSYENSINQYNNLYNHEKFIKICGEYGVSNDLTKWRNQKYFSTWQSRAWETGKPGMSYINKIHSLAGLLRNRMVPLHSASKIKAVTSCSTHEIDQQETGG